MNTTLWILQAAMAVTFMYSGVNKSIFSIRKLVDEKGQTGVEHLPVPVVRFIGISEMLGAIGLILPGWLHKIPVLTPVSGILFALVMIPAGIIHFKRKEPKNVFTNVVLFCICMLIAYGRLVLES